MSAFARQARHFLPRLIKDSRRDEEYYGEPRITQDAITAKRKLMTTNRPTRVNDTIVSFHNLKPCLRIPHVRGVYSRIIMIDRQGTVACSHPPR